MSPLIDPSEQTGKSRAQRIRLDYFRQRHWLYTWRWAATTAAVLMAAAYLAWVAWAPGGKVHLSTGEISTAHASFDHACSQCHIDFVPIAVDAWRLEPEGAIGKTAAKCRHCHAGVQSHGVAFNAAGAQFDQQCSLCHSEHRGRNHQLIPVSNQTCVQCHQDAAQFSAASRLDGQRAIANVTQFSLQEHPDFRSLIPDEATRSRIAFDHALHMQPGQVTPGRRGAMRLDRIAAEHRHRYQRSGDSDDSLVQLQCADCHQFQAASAGRVRSGDFDWGRGSLPVRYDQHCIACHPLTLPGQREGQLGVAHGLSLQALQDSIGGHLAALDTGSGAELFSAQDDELPIRIPGLPSAERAERSVLSQDTSRATATGAALPQLRLQRTVDRVHQQCQLCHTDPDLNAVATLPRLPQPRLRGGRFDHGAHRTMTCIACHPGADPAGQSVLPEMQPALARWLQRVSGTLPPLSQSEVPAGGEEPQHAAAEVADSSQTHQSNMVLGMAACTACHQSPRPGGRSGDRVAAADDAVSILFGGLPERASVRCTTCHQYHGDPHDKGRPASPRDGSPARLPETAGLQASRSVETASQPHRLIGTAVSAAKAAHPSSAAVAAPAASPSNSAAQRLTNAAVGAASGQWIGSDSCATSTCHGGPIRSEVDWNSSQSVFEAYDPHVRAARVLAEPQSRRIVELLDPAAARSPERFQQVMRLRCNGCHLPGQAEGITRQRESARSLAAAQPAASAEDARPWPHAMELLEGVSCEACHGPASGWVQGHLSDDWAIGSAMRNNREYVARLDGCVRCHVGSRRDDGVIRDVNHDLLAAGHPTLRFEPWSALRRLPRHGAWQRAEDGFPEIDGEADLRRFLVGRVVALRAAMRLTVERLEDAITNHRQAVWPELADYDCFACHHSLKIANFATRPRPGFPAPHPWLLSGLVADGLRQVAAEDAAALTAALETLRLRSAGGTQIVPAAGKVEAILNRYLDRLRDPRALPKAVVAWRPFDELHGPRSQPDQRGFAAGGGWYAAAYFYLRSHASLRDSQWSRRSNRSRDHRAVAAELQQLADALEFGRDQQDQPSFVDSPEHFELSVYRRLAERLTDLVEPN